MATKTSKTCKQTYYSPRLKRKTTNYRPHLVDTTESGYDVCRNCGASVYVGQGHSSPQAFQRLEFEAARNDMMR